MEGYCVKCKTKREMRNNSEKLTSKGVKMAQGNCNVCNTKMCKMLGNK